VPVWYGREAAGAPMSRRLSGNDGPGRPARSPRSPETERKGRARCVLQPHPRGSVPRRAEGRTQAPGALGLTVRSARLTRAYRKRPSARGCWPASEEPGQEREDDHDRGTDEDRWPAIVGHLADEEQGFTDRRRRARPRSPPRESGRPMRERGSRRILSPPTVPHSRQWASGEHVTGASMRQEEPLGKWSRCLCGQRQTAPRAGA
jgi:hypothetical protein